MYVAPCCFLLLLLSTGVDVLACLGPMQAPVATAWLALLTLAQERGMDKSEAATAHGTTLEQEGGCVVHACTGGRVGR